MYDVIIIGAGAVGCAAARELSRYELRGCVIDKNYDVCEGTSKANSGIIHAGYDAEPGSVMAKMNLAGSSMMDALAEELDFPFRRNGSLVVCRREEDRCRVQELLERGKKNGVSGLRIVEQDELRAMEPNISDSALCALYAPTAGIVCPISMTIAFAENAAENGMKFMTGTEVLDIQKENNTFTVKTDRGVLETRAVVSAAGIRSDYFHNRMNSGRIHITPRRGEYILLDKTCGGHVKHTIFPLPTSLGKGMLTAPTVHGNLLIGPTADDTEDREGTNVRREGLDYLKSRAGENVKDLPLDQMITSFAGLRAHEDGHDFLIGESQETPGFFEAAGIESPGLTASPAIGREIAEMISEKYGFRRKKNFKAVRKGIVKPLEMTEAERQALILSDPAYGTIICRCNTVSEGEIRDAVQRPLGATTLDGVKRRTWAGMGRCQAGFCTPRIMDILAEQRGLALTDITKCGPGSELTAGRLKDSL